jgi:hypothetical protein
MNRYHELSKQNQDIVDRLINAISSTGNSQLVTNCVQFIIPKAIDKIHEVHREELISQDDQNIMVLAEKVYFAVIHKLDIEDACIVDLGDHTENTDFGKDLYYRIEDTLCSQQDDRDDSEYPYK